MAVSGRSVGTGGVNTGVGRSVGAGDEEAIIISLVGSYVGYRLGKADRDNDSANGLAKTTGKALKTISNQLAWMIDDGLVERVDRGRYRITSLGITHFEQIAEKYTAGKEQ